MSQLYYFFRKNTLSAKQISFMSAKARAEVGWFDPQASEWCFYVQAERPLTPREVEIFTWLLRETFEPTNLSSEPHLVTCMEFGPRLSIETSWSSNMVSALRDCGVTSVIRVEKSIRTEYPNHVLDPDGWFEGFYDPMTETSYHGLRLTLSGDSKVPSPVALVPLLEKGIQALTELNQEMGLGLDSQDIDYLLMVFRQMGRNPTVVEIFQWAQANAEHSRHGFFKGKQVIDGVPMEQSLMDLVKLPWLQNPGNSVIAFSDDASAICGTYANLLLPQTPGRPSPLILSRGLVHLTLTAETHNHPTGIEPYEGAATGAGGIIRDSISVGRGGLTNGLGLGYAVAGLGIGIPGETSLRTQTMFLDPALVGANEVTGSPATSRFAPALKILIDGSNGASDYGNCFGQPVIHGFTRTFEGRVGDEQRGWLKPILYASSTGQVSDFHVHKEGTQKGMLVIQIGGPAYRIGIGGSSASSMMQGENSGALDLASVQRGDPEMEQRLYRIIRACVEMGEANPIVSITDLGAGGGCNAVPELVHPLGANIKVSALPVGDDSLSTLEIWGNESQEREVLLIKPEVLEKFQELCAREGCPVAVIGEITGDGRFVLEEADGRVAVDLSHDVALGGSRQKTFNSTTIPPSLEPLQMPADLTVERALEMVFQLPSVGSKGFLVNKVDRSVGGLGAQQQCVGPSQLPISDFASIAASHFESHGVALSIGEQPIKGLVDPVAMARLAVAEALMNMAGAKISALVDIRLEANWMWAAKLPGEGEKLFRAATALSELLIELGIAIDGGKDSLSMATQVGDGQVVKAPGQLVIAAYAPMPNLYKKATADFKNSGASLILVDLGDGRQRMGGSALAQALGQVGDDCPDLSSARLLVSVFDLIQQLLDQKLANAVHDRSDGGVITTFVEMAMAGGLGCTVDVDVAEPIKFFFNEELGAVIETDHPEIVLPLLGEAQIPSLFLGYVTGTKDPVVIRNQGRIILNKPLNQLRLAWERTSQTLERLQTSLWCVDEQEKGIAEGFDPLPYQLTYTPTLQIPEIRLGKARPKVAILRDEGSNGDREMAASFFAAGFEPWDITTRDLIDGTADLADFVGLAAVGGFSRKDVPSAAKGWAAIIRFNPQVEAQFKRFYDRTDSFSLGVCNGCQLLTVLGLVPWRGLPDAELPRFIQNRSGRFESRWTTIEIKDSPSIFFAGMVGSRLGIWVDHGEGKLYLPKRNQLQDLLAAELVPMVFVDPNGTATMTYPFNPNGSVEGIASLCSPDGRHQVMMPHPERLANQLWQWPYLPKEWKNLEASPWLRLFQNAFNWCQQS